MAGAALFHSFLGAEVSEVATASDASGTGGAVGRADVLSPVGSDFCRSVSFRGGSTLRVPVLVVSLFNGIGGAFRAYDLVGAEVGGFIGYDTSKAASRVVARRWPHAELRRDVRSIDKATVYQWMLKHPHVEQVDLWGGFPCVDLSSVKFDRRNLEGSESGLFREILRVLELLRQVFGRKFRIFFFVENVASMDKSACNEISVALGVKPYRLQCAQAVPISRPRYCWTNKKLPPLPGVKVTDKGDYLEVEALCEYPETSQWLREDSTWDPSDASVVFPTCMKAIKRRQPPPAPAGLSRTPPDAISRWTADAFRYPPYQYKSDYVLWSSKGWRLLEASERELLHGYGWGHTSLCFSASEIKRSFSEHEDQRCSLVGDSFSMYSFVLFCVELVLVLASTSFVLSLVRAHGYGPWVLCPARASLSSC